jgi:hypothetical protein
MVTKKTTNSRRYIYAICLSIVYVAGQGYASPWVYLWANVKTATLSPKPKGALTGALTFYG